MFSGANLLLAWMIPTLHRFFILGASNRTVDRRHDLGQNQADGIAKGEKQKIGNRHFTCSSNQLIKGVFGLLGIGKEIIQIKLPE
jgi:hypothetical protein